MHQQDSKSLAAEDQEAQTDDGTQFEKSLLELKDLCSHLRGAANYCETSFLNAKDKRAVVENTKEYISRAVVTVVDHLGSVSANLECRLLVTNSVSETELRIDNLKQRLGTCEKYSHLLALRYHCWNADFPRYHGRYILPRNHFIRFLPSVSCFKLGLFSSPWIMISFLTFLFRSFNFN